MVERDNAQTPERKVNKAPAKRYLANWTANQRQRNNQPARNDTSLEHPNVSHGINEWTDEENSNDNVCERQPVSTKHSVISNCL